MATRRGVDQGKTTFLKQFLPKNPDAKLADVNEAWREEGHEGEIGISLFSKTRSRLGLTGRRGAGSGATGEAKATVPGGPGKRTSVEAGEARSQVERPEPAVGRRETGSNGSPSRERVLDHIEDGIDDLTVELKRLGGMEEALRALRKVRRIVVRSHEG